jgi:hypothetical protein
MDSLNEILKREMKWYAGPGLNSLAYLLSDDDAQIYAVNAFEYPIHDLPAGIVVMARIVGDTIIIEEDATDKPLVHRLEAAGIPREKIVLAYAGEALPEIQPQS